VGQKIHPHDDSHSEAPRESFEMALEKVERTVRDLEDGNLGLSESLDKFEQGVKYLRLCHDLLAKAERRIELLTGVDESGRPIIAPFDDSATTLEARPTKAATPKTKLRQKKTTDDVLPRNTQAASDEKVDLDESDSDELLF
jgi:exodeoxyribonuclease VII small subunit